jgi:hypothetical protein
MVVFLTIKERTKVPVSMVDFEINGSITFIELFLFVVARDGIEFKSRVPRP